MQPVKANLEHAEYAYGTFAVLPKTLKIKVVAAKTEKGIFAFETVEVKTIGKLLLHPFRK